MVLFCFPGLWVCNLSHHSVHFPWSPPEFLYESMSSYVHFLLKGFLRLLTIHRLFTWPQTRVGNLASLGSHVACHFGASQVLPPSQFRGYALSVHLRPCTETHASVFGNAVQTGC